ncbi:hypothetical protein [Dyadobacter sp. CY347]|uniref:hypothetical protein n=1 Tax=Dyadobacter sp. CY347 TaxID=2909336 RepID=UPI001F19A454|nr:hypothetical protein [Dyadobacter sp. CY347]MCF2491118.1 hypothetical protein [Dyadobacter sp. CY347]
MEDEKIDPAYLKGFNDSYLIAENMPDLSEKISKVEGNSQRLQGMRDGRQQYLSEQLKSKLPSWLKNEKVSTNAPSPSKDITRGVDPPSK